MRFALGLGMSIRGSLLLSGLMVVGSTLSAVSTSQAGTVTFGAGSDQFDLEFVEVGNPSNEADTTGSPNPVGGVGYRYWMGKFEISKGMLDKYNANFGTANSLVITSVGATPDNAATQVTWNEAARFVNWLNTSTGGFAAYKFAPGSPIGTTAGNLTPWTASDVADYDPNNPYRSLRARYALPSVDEWYKAAYYDPVNNVYYDYATGSNTAPTAVLSGTDAGTAVYRSDDEVITPLSTASIYSAGGLSPFGVMGMEGNVMELVESAFDGVNNSGSEDRTVRGGSYGDPLSSMGASQRFTRGPNSTNGGIGFRVLALNYGAAGEVPEPTSMVIFGLGAVGMVYRARRKTIR